ncbi:MAG: hypothetical protein HZA91_08195, partial [Verrucomicrobia bacterium]|nr:hypothetical protein [Verrucomicrobiota bacterium]
MRQPSANIRLLFHGHRVAAALLTSLMCFSNVRAEIPPALDITASAPILNYDSSVLPGNNPNAAAFGYTVIPGCRVLVIDAGAN